jgi:hypothetical protein
MAKRKLYEEPLKAVSNNVLLFYVKSGRPVEPGWIRYVTFAQCYDDTRADITIIFGRLVDDRFDAFEGTDDSTKSVPKWTTLMTHHFRTGELPCFKCVGAVAADVLYAYLEGYETELEEVVTT